MYAQCPSCRTVFRTGPAQLAAAQGRVRCGHCRHVFDVRRHLYARLLDIPSASVEPAARSTELPLSAEIEGPETVPELTRADYSPDLIQVEDLPRISSTEATAKPQAAKSATTFAAQDALEDFNVSFDEELDTDSTLKTDAQTALRRGMKPGLSAKRQPSAWATASWAVAILSLLALLVFQYVYFMRDDLAHYPELRPWLAKLCVQMDCELPALRDLDAFEITHREIRSHPRAKGALLINATFVNKAPFTQPYPVLQISLSDASGRMVALRRLQPAEYLGEGVDVKQGISPQAPVHVVLEVVDPGQNAVGFQFDFL